MKRRGKGEDHADEDESEPLIETEEVPETNEEQEYDEHEKAVKKKDESIDKITDALVLSFFLALAGKIVVYLLELYYPADD